MPRLFIGIGFNEEECAYFLLLQDLLRKICNKGRYTDPANFHLTLNFLGDLPDEKIPPLIDLINTLEVEKMTLWGEHIGFFAKKRGCIAYLGFKPQTNLSILAQRLNGKLEDAGLKTPEIFIYTPHITLCRQARFMTPLVDISKGLDILKELAIANITLFESINLDGQLRYRPIYIRSL